jgi:hypothetical protein
MKRNRLLLTLGLCLPLILATPILFTSTGCKSTPLRTAYVATGTTVSTVETAWDAWFDYVVAGKATRADDSKARELYAKWSAAKQTARDVLLAVKAGQDKGTGDLEVALSAVSIAAADLMQFIKPRIQKIRTP